MILLKTVSLTGGSNRPSNSQLSQQYRTELNTLDVLLSQTLRLKHRVSRCTRLTFYSLFFLLLLLSRSCMFSPHSPFQFTYQFSVLLTLLLYNQLFSIFTFSFFPVLPCFLLPLSPLQSLFYSPFSMTCQWQQQMPASRSTRHAPMIPTYFLSACCWNPIAVTQHSFYAVSSNNLIQPLLLSFLNLLMYHCC